MFMATTPEAMICCVLLLWKPLNTKEALEYTVLACSGGPFLESPANQPAR